MIMKSTLVLFFLGGCISIALARPSSHDETAVEEIEYWGGDDSEMNYNDDIFTLDHLAITLAPKTDIYYPEEPIEAECHVTGMPVPTVEWVHGSGMKEDHDFETNSIIESSGAGMATVVARLIIKPHHIKPGTSRTFTCVGRSGAKIVKSSTTVHFTHETKHPRLNENGVFEALVGAEKTHIYNFFESIFEPIGSNVIMPCKATAKANIYWLNDDGVRISGKEKRFRTLPTGELSISNVQFNDMGTYLCVARNSVSKDVTTTFLYPMAPTPEKH